MDVADIYTLAIDQTHVNTTDFPNTRVLKYINLVKDDFWSYIVTYMNEDYNYDIFTTTSIVDQSEYVLPQIANDAA